VTGEIVERVLRSSRYHDVDRDLVERLAGEEVPRSRSTDEAVKRVKRRLHQAVGAFRGRATTDPLRAVRDAWRGSLDDEAVRRACADVLRGHASTREREPDLGVFWPGVWAITGTPRRLIDLGCGLGPLALPWMRLAREAAYVAVDVDGRPLSVVAAFLDLVEQPHEVRELDLVGAAPEMPADVALLLKLVPTLDQQEPTAAARLLGTLEVRHAVVSFPRRSLGGRGKGMEATYRERLARLEQECGRITGIAEASVPSELVFVLALDPLETSGG
jgi:16S rRNA (guanine(1405)-N(7))-methyltransferase